MQQFAAYAGLAHCNHKPYVATRGKWVFVLHSFQLQSSFIQSVFQLHGGCILQLHWTCMLTAWGLHSSCTPAFQLQVCMMTAWGLHLSCIPAFWMHACIPDALGLCILARKISRLRAY